MSYYCPETRFYNTHELRGNSFVKVIAMILIGDKAEEYTVKLNLEEAEKTYKRLGEHIQEMKNLNINPELWKVQISMLISGGNRC